MSNYTKSVCLLDAPLNLPKQETKQEVKLIEEQVPQEVVEQKTELKQSPIKLNSIKSQNLLPEPPKFGPKTLYETCTQFSITKKRSTLLRFLSFQRGETVREFLKNGSFTELWDLLMSSNRQHSWLPRNPSDFSEERIHLDKLILEEVKTRELDPLLYKEESERRVYFRAIFTEAKRILESHTLSELELNTLKEKLTSSTEEGKALQLEHMIFQYKANKSFEAKVKKDLIFYSLICEFLSTESSESAFLISEMCSEGPILSRLPSPNLLSKIIKTLVKKSTHLLKGHADQARLAKGRTESCSFYNLAFFKLLKVLRLELGEESESSKPIVKNILSLKTEDLGLDPTKGQESEEQRKQLLCGLLEGLPNDWNSSSYDAPTLRECIENKERSWKNLCVTLFEVDPEGKSGILKLLFERAPFEDKKAALFKLFKRKVYIDMEETTPPNVDPDQWTMQKAVKMRRLNLIRSSTNNAIKNLFNSLSKESKQSFLESCTQEQKDFLLPSHQE